MGAIVTVDGMDYEFDIADDGVEFKKDIEKGFKKSGKKTKVVIKKTKDVKPKIPKKREYNE